MVSLGILAKIMVSLCTILHGHGIFAKTMARSWQDLGNAKKGTCHGSGQGYHGFEHWDLLHNQRSQISDDLDQCCLRTPSSVRLLEHFPDCWFRSHV